MFIFSAINRTLPPDECDRPNRWAQFTCHLNSALFTVNLVDARAIYETPIPMTVLDGIWWELLINGMLGFVVIPDDLRVTDEFLNRVRAYAPTPYIIFNAAECLESAKTQQAIFDLLSMILEEAE